jgi:4'-phosphopantetheinyl transferase
MTSSAITVWRIDLRDAGVDAAPRSGFLDPVEIGRAARMRDRLEAERWAYAHAAMRAILARDLGVAESAVVYVHGADEKPCIAGAPSGWDFNLTHSGDLAWLAIARGGAVGIDLERISESVEWRPLLDLVCTPAEAGYVLALPEVSRRERFHRKQPASGSVRRSRCRRSTSSRPRPASMAGGGGSSICRPRRATPRP